MLVYWQDLITVLFCLRVLSSLTSSAVPAHTSIITHLIRGLINCTVATMACSDSSLIFISSNTPSAVLTRIQIIKERLSEKRSELENVLELQDRLAKRYNKVHEEVHHSLTWLIRIDRELRRHGVMSTWEDMVKNHKRFIKLEEKEMTFYKDLFKKDVFEPKNILKMEVCAIAADSQYENDC